MLDFKGIFHDQNIKPNFYEGGAHFKYSDLIKELNKLIKNLSPYRITPNSTQSTSILDEKRILETKLKKNQKKHKRNDSLETNILYPKNISELNSELIKSKKFNCELPDIENGNKIYRNKKNNFNTLKILKNNSDCINYCPQNIINKNSNTSKIENLLPKIYSSNIKSESNLEMDSLKAKKSKKYIRRKKANISLQNSNEKRYKYRKKFETTPKKSEENIGEYNNRKELIEKILNENKEYLFVSKCKDKIKCHENDLKFFQRIDEIKKQLLGLNNKPKKIKLVSSIKLQ